MIDFSYKMDQDIRFDIWMFYREFIEERVTTLIQDSLDYDIWFMKNGQVYWYLEEDNYPLPKTKLNFQLC